MLLLPDGSLWGFGKKLLIYCVQHDPVFCSGLIWSNLVELEAPICDEDFSVVLPRIHLEKDWSLSCCAYAWLFLLPFCRCFYPKLGKESFFHFFWRRFSSRDITH